MVIPITASLAKSRLVFNGQLDLGLAVKESSVFGNVLLENEGETAGNFEFEWDSSLPIKITPKSGTLNEAGAHDSSVNVKVEFFGGDIGVFRAMAQVKLEHQETRGLDIAVTVVDQEVSLLYADTKLPIENMSFGAAFYDQPKKIKALLVNNGPSGASFSVMADEVEGDEVPDEVVTMEPAQGMLAPYETRDVTFSFVPPLKKQVTGFIAQDVGGPAEGVDYDVVKKIEVLETNQQIGVKASGTAFKAQVSCSETVLNFGTARVYDKRDIIVRLKNRNDQMPISFQVPKLASFRVKPSHGTIPPLGTMGICVTYFPSQLGSTKGRVEFVFEDGIFKIPVRCHGHAISFGNEKKQTVAGIDKTDVDFQRELNLVDPDTAFDAPIKYTRPNAIEVMQVDETGFVNNLSYTIPEEEQRQQHKKQYEEYVKSSAILRREKQVKQLPNMRNEPDRVNSEEGFERINQIEENTRCRNNDGMRSPRLELPEPEKEVFTMKQKGAGGGGGRREEQVFDQDKIFKRKFKPRPISTKETRDCKAMLKADQLMSIENGPRSIDFGTTCCYGTVTKSWAIYNPLQEFILVEINCESDELSQSNPQSQCVPPGATAGFDMVLCGDKQGNMRKNVSYTINGHHSNRFNVMATIVPLNIEVDRPEINFRFPEENLEMSYNEQILLTNPWPHPAEFMVEFESDDPFKPQCLSGVVPASSSFPFEVGFTPPENDKGTAKRYQDKFVLNVVGGPALELSCVADFTGPQIEFEGGGMDFEIVSVGTKAEKTLVIKNTGKANVVFHLLPSAPEIILEKSKGKIAAGGKQEIQVNIKLTGQCKFEETITMLMRGGKALEIPVVAESAMPKVAFEEAEFDFGAVTVGDFNRLKVNLKNTGRLPCTAYIDFSGEKNFAVQDDEETEYPDLAERPISIVSSIDDDDRPGTAMSVATDGSMTAASIQPSIYKIDIPRGGTVPFYFFFVPTQVQNYAFELPLCFAGINSDDPAAPPKYVVAGEGLKPRISMSNTIADFGTKVVVKDRLKKAPYHHDLQITNEDSGDVDWSIGLGAVPNDPTPGAEATFTIEPSSGTLACGGVKTIRICFVPENDDSYEFKLPVFLDGDTEKRYIELSVKGIGRFPMITFDEDEVVLPVVPLGLKSIATFHVLNGGHDQLQLQVKLPADTDRIPIQLEFPEGQTLGIGKEKLPVRVLFQTDKPLSFTARVDFLDSDSNRFSIKVTGTADNSLCSVYPYLKENPIGEMIDLSASNPEAPIMVTEVEEAMAKRLATAAAGPTETPDGTEPDTAGSDGMATLPAHVQHGLSFMLRWLNLFVPKCAFSTIPDDFWNSKGKLLFEVIESLSGKSVPGRTGKVTGGKKEQIAAAVKQYEDALNFLKQHGALLNHVKPENLLVPGEHELFIRLCEPEPDPSEGVPGAPPVKKKKRFSARKYVRQTVESWLDVLYQIAKVFMLNRVTAKSFRSMPGIQKKEAEKLTSVTGSNLYSLPEGILLKWCTLHYNKIFPTMQRRVTDFEEDFRDGLVLAALLISHAPYVNSGGRLWASLVKECQSKEDFMQNASKVTNTMKEMSLLMAVTVDDILRPVARDMMLEVLYLYQTLPSYMPRTTIEFTGRLGEAIVKNVELTNPSKNAISYTARIEGSSDFKLSATKFRVEPKAKCPVPIEFLGKFTREVEGVLFLNSDKEGGSLGSTLVFYLKSAIEDIKPTGHFHGKTEAYQPVVIPVTIENPFKGDCRFELRSSQERLEATDIEDVLANAGIETERSRQPTADSKGKKGKKNQAPTVYPPDDTIVEFFHMKEKEIVVKQGSTATINVTFLPFSPGVFQSKLYLLDDEHGEAMVQIYGAAVKPGASETIKVSCETGTKAPHTVALPFLNPAREHAFAMAEKEFGMKRPEPMLAEGEKPQPTVLKVECTGGGSSVFKMNHTSVLVGPGMDAPQVKEGGPVALNGVEVTFVPPQVLAYDAEITVYGPGDLRVFRIEGQGKSPGTEAALKFKAPARTPVQQMIPIVNQTDKAWTIAASFECPQNPKNFNGPGSFSVKEFSTGHYPLEFVPPPFLPDDPQVCKGELLLKNTTIDDKYLYVLEGTVEEPLAEDSIVIKTEVWQKSPINMKVPVIASEGEEITVESDLLYVSGPSTVTMEKGAKGLDVALTVTPKQAGVYNGSVKFTAPSGEFAWFTVEVTAEPAPPVQELEINTALREAVGLDIAISNPLDVDVIFDVYIAGDGLLGDVAVALGPGESSTYELVFSPLNYGVWDGRITFSNQDAGEFWYQLQLSADKPAPIVLEGMECEIGKSSVQVLTMENPIGEALELELANSNSQNYEIVEEEPFVLEPYGSLTLTLQYTPSTLKGEQKAQLIFKNPNVADWEFLVQGKGVPPTLMAQTIMYAPLGRSVTDVIEFKNPFSQTITVACSIEKTGATSANLALTQKEPTQRVPGYGSCNIPVRFTAPNLDDTTGNVVVKAANEGVTWTYPVKGHVFADTDTASSYHYTCRARSRLEETLEIELQGLREIDGEVPVTFEMKIPEAQEKLFARALTIEPAGPLVASATSTLKFNLTFEPLRPLNSTIEFLVHRQNGGVWKYNLELEATEPEIDDDITISSLLGQPSSVTFSLTNQFTQYTPFKAYFTPDSALEFSVEPKSGLLEPYGSNGTQFVVSYTSTAYGRVDTGRLVILTEEMQWTYEVRGTLPQYRPPAGETKINTALPDHVEAELHRIHTRPKKNYLKEQSRRKT